MQIYQVLIEWGGSSRLIRAASCADKQQTNQHRKQLFFHPARHCTASDQRELNDSHSVTLTQEDFQVTASPKNCAVDWSLALAVSSCFDFGVANREDHTKLRRFLGRAKEA
jgi:hypothetical protein